MKTSTPVLGVFAAAGAAAAIYLGTQWSAARGELAQLTQARSADQARIRHLEGELQRRATAPLPEAPTAPVAHTGGAQLAAREQRPPDTKGPDGPMPIPRSERMASIYDTPAGRNERRLQQEIRLRRTYADMPVTLGLDAAQAGKLFDLLTDSQMTANGPSGFPGAWGGTQPADPAAREQRDAAIEDLLGPEKAAEFQSYEKSIPARMQVGRMGESMAAANVPLSETQKSALIAVVASEQQSAPPPQRPADGSSNPDYQTQFLDWQADYSHRVQVRVEPLLTPEQVTLYREAAEVQNARRAEQRTRVEARRSVANGQ